MTIEADVRRGFYVSGGLLTSKHREKISTAIWEFLWLLDHETKAGGFVLNGSAITIDRVARDLGQASRTVRANLHRLQSEGYIECVKKPGHANGYRIVNSKKWRATPAENCRTPETDPGRKLPHPRQETAAPPAENCRANKESRQVDSETKEKRGAANSICTSPHLSGSFPQTEPPKTNPGDETSGDEVRERLKNSPRPDCRICSGSGLVMRIRFGIRRAVPCACRNPIAQGEQHDNNQQAPASAPVSARKSSDNRQFGLKLPVMRVDLVERTGEHVSVENFATARAPVSLEDRRAACAGVEHGNQDPLVHALMMTSLPSDLQEKGYRGGVKMSRLFVQEPCASAIWKTTKSKTFFPAIERGSKGQKWRV